MYRVLDDRRWPHRSAVGQPKALRLASVAANLLRSMVPLSIPAAAFDLQLANLHAGTPQCATAIERRIAGDRGVNQQLTTISNTYCVVCRKQPEQRMKWA